MALSIQGDSDDDFNTKDPCTNEAQKISMSPTAPAPAVPAAKSNDLWELISMVLVFLGFILGFVAFIVHIVMLCIVDCTETKTAELSGVHELLPCQQPYVQCVTSLVFKDGGKSITDDG